VITSEYPLLYVFTHLFAGLNTINAQHFRSTLRSGHGQRIGTTTSRHPEYRRIDAEHPFEVEVSSPISSKLSRIVLGHPTTTRYPVFDTLCYQHHAFKMGSRELAIQSTISDLNVGVSTSQRKAAETYGVPQSTLQERINGRQSHAIAHQ
jgi:hypothetical protein